MPKGTFKKASKLGALRSTDVDLIVASTSNELIEQNFISY